jgi:hypothetical protein
MYSRFDQLIQEALAGVDPVKVQDIIGKSFSHTVVSDLLAKQSIKGKRSNFKWKECPTCPSKHVCDAARAGVLEDTNKILEDLKQKVPTLFTTDIKINVGPFARVVITFDEQGGGSIINVPRFMNKELGAVIILHEIAHKLYSIDILTNDIIMHPYGVEIFTLARTIEDARVERLMEQEYPGTAQVFKSRAKYIVPIYKSHSPTPFAKVVDDLFLYLRGYVNAFSGPKELVALGQQFIEAGNDRDKKVSTVIALGEAIMKYLNK